MDEVQKLDSQVIYTLNSLEIIQIQFIASCDLEVFGQTNLKVNFKNVSQDQKVKMYFTQFLASFFSFCWILQICYYYLEQIKATHCVIVRFTLDNLRSTDIKCAYGELVGIFPRLFSFFFSIPIDIELKFLSNFIIFVHFYQVFVLLHLEFGQIGLELFLQLLHRRNFLLIFILSSHPKSRSVEGRMMLRLLMNKTNCLDEWSNDLDDWERVISDLSFHHIVACVELIKFWTLFDYKSFIF